MTRNTPFLLATVSTVVIFVATASQAAPQAPGNPSLNVGPPPATADKAPRKGPKTLATGSECTDADACRGSNSCMTVHYKGAEYKRSYCTKACDPTANKPCDGGATCVATDDGGVCLARRRPNHRCVDGTMADGDHCRPQCTTDDDCATGSCDTGTRLCVSKQTKGSLKVGERCNPGGGKCEGTCVQVKPGYAQCTKACEQTFYGTCQICLPPNGDYSAIDTGAQGSCFQPCSTTSDCGHPDAVCDPFTGFNLGRKLFKSRGVCRPKS